MPRKKEDWTGIYKHYASRDKKAFCWRAVVSRGRGQRPSRRHFPPDTAVSVMQSWRKDEQAQIRLERKAAPVRRSTGTFAADVETYLAHPDVKRLTTYAERTKEIQRWLPAFGAMTRHDITAPQIRAVRDHWAKEPRSERDRRPLSPGRINKLTRALSNLWAVLDGRRAANPVRDVDELKEPAPTRRDIDAKTLAKILDHLSDEAYRPKDGTAGTGSKARARLRVMAFTGLPSGTLAKLTPQDIDWKRKLLVRPARKKGQGQPASIQPLSQQAYKAFREFDKLGCWGAFSRSPIRQALRRAALHAGYTKPIRPYDLRHSFLTDLARASKDEIAVMEIAQHASISTTRRYTHGSVSARAIDAMKAYERRR